MTYRANYDELLHRSQGPKVNAVGDHGAASKFALLLDDGHSPVFEVTIESRSS